MSSPVKPGYQKDPSTSRAQVFQGPAVEHGGPRSQACTGWPQPRGGGDPASPGSRRTVSQVFSILCSLLATAPCEPPIARHRRGYPRALTDSNPGAGGGGGRGGAWPLRTRSGEHLPLGTRPGWHLRALRGRAVVLRSNHIAFGVPKEHESPPGILRQPAARSISGSRCMRPLGLAGTAAQPPP